VYCPDCEMKLTVEGGRRHRGRVDRQRRCGGCERTWQTVELPRGEWERVVTRVKVLERRLERGVE